MSATERGTTDQLLGGLAVGLVMVLSAVNLFSPGLGPRGGSAAQITALNTLVAQGDWDAAAALSAATLRRYPFESRLHFLYARSMFERGFSGIAAEHLVLSRTPVPRTIHSQRSLPPSEQEAEDLLARMDAGDGRYFEGDWGRLRRLRLASLSGDWSAWDELLKDWALVADAVSAPGETCPRYTTVFSEVVLGAQADSLDSGLLACGQLQSVLQFAQMKTIHAGLLGVTEGSAVHEIAVLAGGVYVSGSHSIALNDEIRSYEAAPNWLLLHVDLKTGMIEEKRATLRPLTGEGALLQEWAAVPEHVLAVGFASGEAVDAISPEARVTLREQLRLHLVPPEMSTLAYAFVLRDVGGEINLGEAQAVARDMPAMLAIRAATGAGQ